MSRISPLLSEQYPGGFSFYTRLLSVLEARTGIEPMYEDLQSSA